jgi:acyl carrier protein
MTHDEVQAAVFETCARFFDVDPGTVTRETTAADVRGWDSVSNMPFVLEVEDRLEIELPLKALGSLANVGELVDLCHKVKSGA